MVTRHKDIIRAHRLLEPEQCHRPIAQAIVRHSELVQIARESDAKAHNAIAKTIKHIATLCSLTPSETAKLSQCDALCASARHSRRAYEADIYEGSTHKHIAPCGPTKPITGKAYYEVLKHNHSPSIYKALHKQGVFSHNIPLSGPAKVSQLANNIAPSRLPSPDALASNLIGTKASALSARRDLDKALRKANLKRKRGHRNRGKGHKTALT
jgi:hypothetical protein